MLTTNRPAQVALWPDVIVMSDELRPGPERLCRWCNDFCPTFTVPTLGNEALAAASFCRACLGLVDKPQRFFGVGSKAIAVLVQLHDGSEAVVKGDYCAGAPMKVTHLVCCQGATSRMSCYDITYRADAGVVSTKWECTLCRNEVHLKYFNRSPRTE